MKKPPDPGRFLHSGFGIIDTCAIPQKAIFKAVAIFSHQIRSSKTYNKVFSANVRFSGYLPIELFMQV